MRVGHVPARDPQRPVKRFRRTRFLDPEILRGLFGLTPRACWSRLQRGRSPFAPTFPDRRPNLPRIAAPRTIGTATNNPWGSVATNNAA